MRIALGLLAMAVLAGAAPEVDDAAPRAGEWGQRPADGTASSTDPPAFVWRPQGGARSYDLQVARDAAFADIAYEIAGLPLHAHAPPRTLGVGSYVWRFRFVTADGERSAWSGARSFHVAEDAVPFPMPPEAALRARIPREHPRLFMRPEDLPRLRALARDRLRKPWEAVVRDCERLLANPVDATEPLKYQPGEVRGLNDDLWRKRWWGNRVRTIEVVDGSATLAFGWLIGGDERYAREARRLLLAACEWDPEGATGYTFNDEAGMPFAYGAARAYTWLHDFLAPEERGRVRAAMRVRGEQMYRHLSGKSHLWRPYSSHANRAWHWLGEVAIAFHGEIEGADDWLRYATHVFWCSYPVWSDDAGGWHEGLAYWNSYVGRVTWWLATMKATLAVDGYRKPYFARAGDFALYVAPPGERQGGFGDLAAGQDAGRLRGLMTILAREAHNPHWQWYVNEAGGPAFGGGYGGFLQETGDPVAATPPRDLPSSALFPGVGIAALHHDLCDRDEDVQVVFKASPMGTQSHGYESHNAFLLSVAGDPVFIRSGQRDLYGSPHHRNWMWETRSVNSVLIDRKGQRTHDDRPVARITQFGTSPLFDYVVGEAGAAYGKGHRFTRAVCLVKPETVVILDVLAAPAPATFQWLLHAPNEMRIDGATVRAHGERAGALVQFLWPPALEITQTDRFRPPPREWVRLRQWHLTASTAAPAAAQDFVTLVRCNRRGKEVRERPAEALRSENALGCAFDTDGGRAVVVWRRHGTDAIRLGEIETDGDAALVLLDAEGRPARGEWFGGSVLACGAFRLSR